MGKRSWGGWLGVAGATAAFSGVLASIGACGSSSEGVPGQDAGGDATNDHTVPDANGGDAAQPDAGGDAACAAGQTSCNGACVDTQADPSHCGACGVSCGATACYAGRCGGAITEVSAGDAFGCVVRVDGTVWCVGANQYGELGATPTGSLGGCGAGQQCSKTLQKISGVTKAVAVTTGQEFACALDADGTVWCWGKNDRGQLGHDPTTDPSCADPADAGTSTKCSVAPTQVPFPAGVKIARVIAGWQSTCAVTRAADGGSGGDVYCWGDNRQDEAAVFQDAGSGTPPVASVTTPTKVQGFASDVVDVRAALQARFACALRTDGTVWCWGATYGGRLGIPSGGGLECSTPNGNLCTPVPVQVRVRDADAGADAGDAGDVGLAAPLTDVKEVRVGTGTGCALKNDGTVWCWGNDGFAVLGDTTGSYDPNEQHPGARQVTGVTGARALAFRYATAFATDDAGAVVGWGQSTWGAMGNGSVAGNVACPKYSDGGSCVVPPAAVTTLAGVKALSAGVGFGFAIAPDGGVLAWGRNDHAQLGHDPMTGGDRACGQYVADPSYPYAEQAPCNPTPSPLTLP